VPTDSKALLAAYRPKAAKPLAQGQQLCQVRYSPDGKTLAAGTFEGTVRRWDAAATPFADLPVLSGHNGWVQCLAFHPDGKRLFSADSWGRLTCWPFAVQLAKPLWSTKDAHDGWIHAMAMSVDGTWLATGGRDQTIRITSPDDGKAVRTLAAGEDVLALMFHPDGKSLVSGDLKGVIKQWELGTGKVARDFDAKAMFLRDRIQDVGGVRAFALSPDGATLFAGGSQPKSGGFVQGVSLILAFDWKSGKGRTVYKGSSDNEGYVYELAWHAGGFLVGVSSGQPGQGKLFFHHPDNAQPFFTQPIPNPHSVAVHPNGKRLVVSATNANSAGNGRNIGKAKEYPGNFSPLHVFDLPA
jgi:WD40 repeat protein